MHKKITEMIENSIGEEIHDRYNTLGKEYFATEEDGKATLYDSITGKIIEEGIEVQYGKGGEDHFIFYSKKLRRRFAYPTSGGEAEWLCKDTYKHYLREEQKQNKYLEEHRI